MIYSDVVSVRRETSPVEQGRSVPLQHADDVDSAVPHNRFILSFLLSLLLSA